MNNMNKNVVKSIVLATILILLLVQSVNAEASVECITNGEFDGTTTGWTFAGPSFATVADTSAYEGSYCAYINYNREYAIWSGTRIKQTIQIPDVPGTLKLEFYERTYLHEWAGQCGIKFDDNWIFNINYGTPGRRSTTTGWTKQSIDISEYKGQTVDLAIIWHDPSQQYYNYYDHVGWIRVDDIKIVQENTVPLELSVIYSQYADLGRTIPIDVKLTNHDSGSIPAYIHFKLDGSDIIEPVFLNVPSEGSISQSYIIPAFVTQGTYNLNLEVYDESGLLLKSNELVFNALPADNLRILEKSDEIHSKADDEIMLMAWDVAEQTYISASEAVSFGVSEVTARGVGNLLGSTSKNALDSSAAAEKEFVDQYIGSHFELFELCFGMVENEGSAAESLVKRSVARYKLYKVKDESNAIDARDGEFRNLINSAAFQGDMKSINKAWNKGIAVIDSAPSSATVHFTDMNPTVERALLGSFMSIYPGGPIASELIYDLSFEDWKSLFKDLNNEKKVKYLKIFIIGLSLLIMVICAIVIVCGSGGVAAIGGGTVFSIIKGILSIADAAPPVLMVLVTLGSTIAFQYGAVPFIVDQHDQTLDAIEGFMQPLTQYQASVNQIEVNSIDSNEVSVDVSLDGMTLDPIVNLVYSPDGRIIKMYISESSIPRTSSTSTLTLNEQGEYTVVSATYTDISMNTAQTASVESNLGNVVCVLSTDKELYSVNESVTLTAEFTSNSSEDLGNLTYYLYFEDGDINETGTINLPTNSSVTKTLTFTPQENGGYKANAILLSGLAPIVQKETGFVVGSGSSVSLDAMISRTFEPGTMPFANISLKCAGSTFEDSLLIQTTSTVDDVDSYENITSFTVGENSTLVIQVPLLNESRPGVYRVHISYANSSVTQKFTVEAEDTIHINPFTDKMIYDLGDPIWINITCENQSYSLNSFDFGVEHTYPNGTIETLLKTEVTTGNYLATLSADVNGTHYIKTFSESNTMRVYAEDTFFIVNKRSNPSVSQAYFSTETGVVAFKIASEEEVSIEKATVTLNNTTSFTDGRGYVSFYEEGRDNITLEIKKPGYASYYGELGALDLVEDSVSPSVEITSIQEGGVYSDYVIYLSGSLVDNVRVENAYYVTNNKSMSTLNLDENGNFSVLIEDSRLIYGVNNITVIAYDVCGNAGEGSVSFTLREPLKISVNSPLNGTTYNTFPEINITTNEEATFVYNMNGHNETNVSLLDQYITEGQNIFIVYATDFIGKTTSKEVLFYFESQSGGDGTESNPYKVYNVYDLQAVNNNLSAHYILMNDIDASATSTWNNGAGFVPIGNSTTKFTGTFDGQNYTISELHINRPSTDYVGLFGYINGVDHINESHTIENVNLDDVYVIGNQFTGGLVGYASMGGISQCQVSGYIKGTYSIGGFCGSIDTTYIISSSSSGTLENAGASSGGLVGETAWNCEIVDSTSSMTIIGNYRSGGLVGMSYQTNVTNGYSIGSVSGTMQVGGLVGYAQNSSFINTYSTGSVSGSSSYVGGLVGYHYKSNTIASHSSSSVTGSSYSTGGLVGEHDTSSITNSYANGTVAGKTFVGGLVGSNYNSNVANSYSCGAVSGTSSLGGLVGTSSGTVTSSYWDTQTSGRLTSAGGTGKTTAQMKTQSTFVNWDFEDTWVMQGYPKLRWEISNEKPVAEFTSNVTSGIAPLVVSFADQSANIPTSWLWDFGDGATSTDQNPAHTYTSAGAYTVSLTAVNSCGSNTSTRTDYITVSNINAAPVLSPIGDIVIDEDQTLSLTLLATDDGDGPLTYSVTYTSGTVPFGTLSGNTFTWTPSASDIGVHELTFTVSDGSLSDSETVSITVNNVNDAPLLINFVAPTADNASVISENYALINVTISALDSQDNITGFIDWNNSLVGWWRLEGNGGTIVEDYSTYQRNGTMYDMSPGINNGTSGWTTEGKFGNAMMFDGLDDRVQISHNSVYNIPIQSSGKITMEAWVYPLNLAYESGILSKRSNYRMILRPGGELKFQTFGWTGGGTSSKVKVNEWSHIAITYDGEIDQLKFYLNGNNVRTVNSYLPNGGTNSNNLLIGRGHDLTMPTFNGTIDEVRLWKRALTTEEIKASYNAGLYRLETNITGLEDGTYAYKAYAQDSAGNVNQTETRIITIDT
jgi:PKD repeat protein